MGALRDKIEENSMRFNVYCRMIEQIVDYSTLLNKEVWHDHFGAKRSYGTRTRHDDDDIMAIIFDSRNIPGLRLVNPEWLADWRNVRIGTVAMNALTVHDEDLATLVVKQWIDAAGESGVDDADYEWMLQTLEKTEAIFDEGGMFHGANGDSFDYSALVHSKSPVGKDRFADMFYYLYKDADERKKDEEADGFLPGLMKKVSLFLDYTLYPNNTVKVERFLDVRRYFKFVKCLYDKFGKGVELDNLRRNDEELYMEKTKYNIRRVGSESKFVQWFRYDEHDKWHDWASEANPYAIKPEHSSDVDTVVVKDGEAVVVKADRYDVRDWRTTAKYMKYFLGNPIVTEDGRVFPNIFVGRIKDDGNFFAEAFGDGDVGHKWTNSIAVAEAGVQFGFLDPNTLEIKRNPLTGKPYCPADYERGLIGDEIIKTTLYEYGKPVKETLEYEIDKMSY